MSISLPGLGSESPRLTGKTQSCVKMRRTHCHAHGDTRSHTRERKAALRHQAQHVGPQGGAQTTQAATLQRDTPLCSPSRGCSGRSCPRRCHCPGGPQCQASWAVSSRCPLWGQGKGGSWLGTDSRLRETLYPHGQARSPPHLFPFKEGFLEKEARSLLGVWGTQWLFPMGGSGWSRSCWWIGLGLYVRSLMPRPPAGGGKGGAV